HGLLGLTYRAFLETKIVVTHRAVANAGEVKAQNHKTHRRQGSRNFHVNAPWSNPMHDARIQEKHRCSRVPSHSRRVCHNPDERLLFPEENSFFFCNYICNYVFHECVLPTQATIDCSTWLGTSKLPSAVGSQIWGASKHWDSSRASVRLRRPCKLLWPSPSSL